MENFTNSIKGGVAKSFLPCDCEEEAFERVEERAKSELREKCEEL